MDIVSHKPSHLISTLYLLILCDYSCNMSLWNKLFKPVDLNPPIERFQAQFGRFTDANKTPDQHEAWDEAMSHFEQRDYPLALDRFIYYIQDPAKSNIIRKDNSTNSFQILQGSKTIEVQVKNGHLQVQCHVAIAEQLHIGFMRRLLDLNYELKYVRYGLSDEQIVTLLFDTALDDASPYKLYFALKELSIHADKQDELLVNEFGFLKPIQAGRVEALPAIEQAHKLDFIKKSIAKAIDIIDKGRLKIEQYPAAGGYILLALLYKLDYLIRPEGSLMDKIELIHKSYFSQDNKNLLQKLKQMRLDLSKIGLLSDQDILHDLYVTTFTFGITSPANTAMVIEVLDREIQNCRWYMDNQYPEYVIAIIEYAAGICLFNFALPPPIKELFTMIYRVTEPEYFVPVEGYGSLLNEAGLPDRSAIRQELNMIEKKYLKEYPSLRLDARSLAYDQVSSFVYSLIQMIRPLQLNKNK